MNILICCDSFKGSLSSLEVGKAITTGVNFVFPNSNTTVVNIADGGEGTIMSLAANQKVKHYHTVVHDPLMNIIEAQYIINDKQEAFIEMVEASGLSLIKKKNILYSNTYGTGELIKDALDKKCQTIYIGIGGSATNDGGIGMAHALGVKFLDINKQEVNPIPINIQKICSIDMTHLDSRVHNTKFIILSDVTNPLCGPNGASVIYGPQKGANTANITFLDHGLLHLSRICQQSNMKDYSTFSGSGAAGGLGFGLLTFVNATMCSGMTTIMHMIQLESKIKKADLVITGEGRIDRQSLFGKVPIEVAKLAKKHTKPVVAITGSIGDINTEIYQYLDAIESCVYFPCQLEEALKNANENIIFASIRLMQSLKTGMEFQKLYK